MANVPKDKYGAKAIKVVEFEKQTTDGGVVVTPRIHVDKIRQIIKDSNAENIPVVIISVAGVARSGKSFFLNLMRSRNIYQVEKNKTDWINSGSKISGFNWAQSDKAVTLGMWMWERAIVTKLADGSEVAFLYMDTQGTGDRIESDAANMDSLIMFLSLEISAIQIHNINMLWRIEDTEVYKVSKMYGEMVDKNGSNGKPFNSLVLLYRNWENDDILGFRENYIDEEIRQNASAAEYIATLKGIKESFNSVSATMLPHPGKKVVKAKEEFMLADIDEDFLTSLEALFSRIYGPHGGLQKDLAVCKKGSQVVKVLEELQSRIEGADLPAIQKPIDHLAETVNYRAYKEALRSFNEEIDKTASQVKELTDLDSLGKTFNEQKQSAMVHYRSKAFRHGGQQIKQHYGQKLERETDEVKLMKMRRFEIWFAAEEVFKREGASPKYMALMRENAGLKAQIEKAQTVRGWDASGETSTLAFVGAALSTAAAVVAAVEAAPVVAVVGAAKFVYDILRAPFS